MTLRYEGNRPVGLDWAAISPPPEPQVWKVQATPAPRPRKRQPVQNPGVGKGGGQRTPAGVEQTAVRLYVIDRLSCLEVGRELGMAPATVAKILVRHQVQARSKAEAMRISRAKRDQ